MRSFGLLTQGAQIWVGFTEWYYSIYYKPWEGVAESITRLWDRWQACAEEMNLNWAFKRGSLPKSSLASLLAWTVELVSARPLSGEKQARFLFPWRMLWQHCNYSGQVYFGTRSLSVENSKVEKLAILQAWMEAFPELPIKRVVGVLDKMGSQTVMDTSFGLIRCCKLHPHWPPQALKFSMELARSCLIAIESQLGQITRHCMADPPASVRARHSYHGGRSATRKDPRKQACKALSHFRLI